MFWLLSGTNMYYNAGNVGIGTSTPSQKLSVVGTIESTSGGFKFPDGTTQATNSFRGVLVYLLGTQNIVTNNQDAVIFNAAGSTEVYDTDNIHNSSSNPTRLTVPSGVNYIKLLGNIYFDGIDSSDKRWAWMRKNGGQMIGQPYSLSMGAASSVGLNIISPILPVQSGDYFELIAMVNPTTNIRGSNGYDTYSGYATWFAMEIIK